jgi:site-specific DNA-adenine methylase
MCSALSSSISAPRPAAGFNVSYGRALQRGEANADAGRSLAGVVIECLPWADFIARYDRLTTLLYLDPPYYGGEKDYGAEMFDRAEYAKMADVLRGIKGRFILSINDVPHLKPVIRSPGQTMHFRRVSLLSSRGADTSQGSARLSKIAFVLARTPCMCGRQPSSRALFLVAGTDRRGCAESRSTLLHKGL